MLLNKALTTALLFSLVTRKKKLEVIILYKSINRC